VENEDIVSALTAMSGHPSELDLSDLRDELLDGAECRFDPELHTGPDPLTAVESPDERAAREDVAREVCQSCPVAATCLAYALRAKPERGVWAGFTADQITNLAALPGTHPDALANPPVVLMIDEATHLFTASNQISATTAARVAEQVLRLGRAAIIVRPPENREVA
jgi:WhiB family redox-sensing transcriptional regulator